MCVLFVLLVLLQVHDSASDTWTLFDDEKVRHIPGVNMSHPFHSSGGNGNSNGGGKKGKGNKQAKGKSSGKGKGKGKATTIDDDAAAAAAAESDADTEMLREVIGRTLSEV